MIDGLLPSAGVRMLDTACDAASCATRFSADLGAGMFQQLSTPTAMLQKETA